MGWLDSNVDEHEQPSLRGVSHHFAFYAAVLAGVALVAWAPEGRPGWAAAVFAASLALTFGTSALLHRGRSTGWLRHVIRRLDHSAIFVLIAGTYTPMCLLSLPPPLGAKLLIAIWGMAAFGIVKSMLWPHAPRWLTAGLYVLTGCMVLPFLPAWWAVADPMVVGLIVGGGAIYIGGALAYAAQRPNPIPEVFGYHEVFHALVIVAGGCHFAAVALTVGAA